MPPEDNDNMNPKKPTRDTTKPISDDSEDIFPVAKTYSTATTDTAASATSLDPQEVFNASIEFQHTFMTPPSVRSMEYRGSSNTRRSLYPSLASLDNSDEALDVEKNWKAASRASMKDQNSSQPAPLVSESEMKMEAASLPSRDSYAAVAFIPSATTSEVASMPDATSRPTADGIWISPARNTNDDDLVAQKLAAYSGGNGASTCTSASTTTGDDMVAIKRAAYGGLYNYSSPCLQDPEHHAQAIMVEYDVHSAEGSADACQEELVASMSCSEVPSQNCNVPSVSLAGTSSAAPKATVTDSGAMGKPAAEATVMHDSGISQGITDLDCKPPARDSPAQTISGAQGELQAEATIIDCDAHPAEVSMEAVQAEFVGQGGGASDGTAQNTPATNSQKAPAQASEVIDSSSTSATYQVNGQELVEEQVTEVDVIESGPMEKATAEAWSATTSGEAQVMEGTTEPLFLPFTTKPTLGASTESGQSEGCSESDAFPMVHGQAEVVGISEEVHPAEFVNMTSAEAELVGPDFNTAIAVHSGENDYHGMDCEPGGIEQAQIIVESYDDNTGYHGSDVAPPPQRRPQEAHATLVSDGECSNYDERAANATPVSAVLEPYADSGRSTSAPLPATPVTVLEESPAVPPRVSFSDGVKHEPYSGRIVSAPIHPTAQLFAESYSTPAQPDICGADAREQDWTLIPSFGGMTGDTPTPIPSTVATANELNHYVPVPPPIPSPHPVGQGPVAPIRNRAKSNASSASASENSVPGFQMISSGIARGANNVIESLFGNGMPGCRRPQSWAGANMEKMSGSILPRTLLPSSVIYSEATNSWVATVNTNQKALEANNVEESSKALRAFSVPTEKQATALACAWAPPQMQPFGSNPMCFICEAQFTVFRRACHCRNCGVCVCGPCSVQWPAKMLPVTYNIKKESIVNICKACDWLCSEFRLALLHGDHDKAVALHSTGNINLTTPFANVKGELFYPVHCAVLGGNLKLLKWLVDEHCCPLRSIRISNGRVRGASGSYTPILTSKGRSLLGIALGNRNIGIVRYLVVEKKMLLSAEKGLLVETLTQNLDLVLRVLPEEVLVEQALTLMDRNSTRSSNGRTESMSAHSESDVDMSAMNVAAANLEDGAGADSECIICFDNTINCVFTPCGHQICCLECGNHISRCPVCAVDCIPMRVFKP